MNKPHGGIPPDSSRPCQSHQAGARSASHAWFSLSTKGTREEIRITNSSGATLVSAMGPQSEGGPSGTSRAYGGSPAMGGDGRYQSTREIDPVMQSQQQMRMNAGYGSDGRGPSSPAMSNGGKDRDGELKLSGDRDRSRNRSSRKGSGQLRLCKKCGEPLTGQFVRALGGTFHLDCFRCRVSDDCFFLFCMPVANCRYRIAEIL